MQLRPDRIVRNAIRSRYIVTTVNEETFDGVLLDADAKTIVLADVVQIAASGARASVAGQLILPRDTVKYLQTVTV